jgi:phospho-N-acetylmuramoyl-pentapeptide-transferase
MISLIKAIIVVMISFLISIILSLIIIPILKRVGAKQSINRYISEHNNKNNTPTMGGIIFIISTMLVILILIIFGKIKFNSTLLILIFTFLSYSLIGIIDDLKKVLLHNNDGIKESTKFFLQVIVAIVFFYLFIISGNEPLLWIHTLNIKIDIGFFYGLFILLVLVASSNAVNLTDGLDGLATGLSIIALTTLGIISFNTGWLEGYESVALMCFALSGSMLGFLLFNANPARVFMGDTGSLAVGAFMGSVAIMTRHELLLIVIGIVFVIETLSCIIQRIYYKFTKKRIFLKTPIHHTFQLMGYKEIDIVRVFWTIGLISSMIALIFGVIL